MSDWTVDEHKTAAGKSHFAQFVAALSDAKDIKDTAVLVRALGILGNQLREPRSKSLGGGLFELRGTRVRIYYAFRQGRRVVLLGGYVKKRKDTPDDVLALMRARLMEVESEYQKPRNGAAPKKGR